MFHTIIIVILKLSIFGIYFYDYSRTKKLLKQDRTIKRMLSLPQKIEVYLLNIFVVIQFIIPLVVINETISTVIHVVGLIITYWHLNRWVFISKKSLICRDEIVRTKMVQKAKYENHRLTFKVGSRQYKILFPLVTKEHLENTIL